MKKILAVALSMLMLQGGLSLVLSPVTISAQTQEILNNASIIQLVKSGLSDAIIISMIKSSKHSFNTSATEILALKKSGVSDAVILQMVQSGSNSQNQNQNNNSTQSTPPNEFKLPDGTPVRLRIARTISSADAKTGDTIDFEVLEDVTVDNVVVIPRGGVALGTVTRAKPRGRMGKGGKLDINIDSVRLASGDKIALRAIKEGKGSSSTGMMTGAIVATSILFFPAAPIFLFMKGKDITIAKGTEVTAYTNGEALLDYNKFNKSVN